MPTTNSGESVGADMIATERHRQLTEEGWSANHDDVHDQGELRDAAIAYAMVDHDIPSGVGAEDIFPWEASEWWKPSEDPIRNLIKAGALLAAEIDRLLRAQA